MKPKVEVPQETVGSDEDEFDDDLDEDDEEDEDEVPEQVETPTKAKKVAPQTSDAVSDEEKAQAEMQEQAQRVMLLQDNGVFRSELLSQLNEIRKALNVLANIGIDLAKPNEQK